MLEDVKNVEQSVTFYNVTGYIEKENRIYFAPLNKQLVANAQAGTTKPLCQWYKDYFDSVVGILSSRYQNVSISRWSPSDRTLSVQGTIDLFRKSGVSSDSKAFNYMIVKREVTGVTSQDASINYTYYMGYFITDVQQSGTNTVRLTLDIDNFTNAFYLMNTKQYSDSELLNLDIFNTTLVNCNVERQHYNRVKLVDGEVKIDNNEIFLNPLESYDYKYQKKVSKSPILVNGVTQQVTVTKSQDFPEGSDHYDNFLTNREYIVRVESTGVMSGEVNFTYNSGDVVVFKEYRTDDLDNPINQIGGGVEIIRKLELNRNGTIKITYTDLDGQHNETFNPSSQSRVYTLTFGTSAKPTISADSTRALIQFKSNVFNAMTNYLGKEESEPSYNFTQEEMQEIKSLGVNDWFVLSEITRRKCLSACIHFMHIKTKENIGACYGALSITDPEQSPEMYDVSVIAESYRPNKTRGYLSDNVIDSTYSFIVPILIVPNFLEKFRENIESTVCNVYVRSLLFSEVSHSTTSASWNRQWTDYKLASSGTMRILPKTSDSLFPYISNRVEIPTSFAMTILGTSDWADVILSATIIKDLPNTIYEITDVNSSQPQIRINSNIVELVPYVYQVTGEPRYVNYLILKSLVLPKGLWFTIVPRSRADTQISEEAKSFRDYMHPAISGNHRGTKGFTYIDLEIDTTIDNMKTTSPLYSTMIMFQLSGMESKRINLSLEEKEIEDITSIYYDPILENNPYTFYSLSLSSGLEVPLNKQKYYNTYNESDNCYKVPFKYVYSNNDAQKIGLIPLYSIDDFETEYYNDSLIVTLSAQVPLVSDSYTSFYTMNQAQMKNQFAVNDYQRTSGNMIDTLLRGSSGILAKGIASGYDSAIGEAIKTYGNEMAGFADWAVSNNVIAMNQKAQLAGAGAKPDVVKQAGSDVSFDILSSETAIKLNYYRIDDFSYNSIAKGLERFGYLVNRYDALHVADRVGWNYVKLISADFNHYGEHLNLTTEQESDIMDIFREGVTLLHSPEYLYNQSLHNHETLIDIDD